MNENMGRDFMIAGVCFLLSLIWMGLSTMFPGGIGCALDFVLEKFKIEPNEVTTVLGIVLTTAIEVVFILIMLLHIINILENSRTGYGADRGYDNRLYWCSRSFCCFLYKFR